MPPKRRKTLEWTTPLIASEVDAHPELLSIPTFVLFVQKDELQMSRAEVRKEDRLEAQKEFEMWLEKQTAPRQAPPKKQMQNEESLAPVDDKERSAVAVRTAAVAAAAGGPRGISRPSSDGFRPRGGQPLGQSRFSQAQVRPYNSQRGVRPMTQETASPPRSRATTMADTIAANSMPDPGYVKDAPAARSPTRKTPTPRPGSNGRPKTPTPRPSNNSAQRRRPPSARKENGNRVNQRPGSATSTMGSARQPSATNMGSARPQSSTAKRKTPRATPRRDRPPSGPPGGPVPVPVPPAH
mmetsp:Transcript_27309/g.69500  ORF Transcript_27309/g.69500 Transcript_27309/m.69500 type:complete len:297 (-) Transcript_27309:518-1408(-)